MSKHVQLPSDLARVARARMPEVVRMLKARIADPTTRADERARCERWLDELRRLAHRHGEQID